MPEWDTNTRGQNRKEDSHFADESDYDGLSCMVVEGVWPNGGYGVEDTTILHGLGLNEMDSNG